jgi:S-formylglutathione hydrolase FrmB
MARSRLLLVVVLFGSLCGVAALAGRTASASTLVTRQVHSRALEGTLRFGVWLPRSYARQPRHRYPVLYVLHGLPGDAASFQSLAFLVPLLDRLEPQAIVVFPQGARSDAPDDEYQDLGPGRDWETALTSELPAAVAARYRTLPGRNARGIVGISAGGYGAIILGLHHLARYAVIESWSGYFHPTTPDGSAPMRFARPGKAAAADAHRLVPGLASKLRQNPTLIGFFSGAADPYPGFTAENRAFDRELTAAGVPHRFAIYPGGHDVQLWLAHARDWLAQAFAALAPAH